MRGLGMRGLGMRNLVLSRAYAPCCALKGKVGTLSPWLRSLAA